MRKKSVVLCELCEEDRLAVSLVHWGLCMEHRAAIGGAAVVDGESKRGGTSRRQPTVHANRGSKRRGYTKRLHKPCGEMIDPRGWTKHVKACRGKGKVATRRKAR